MRRLQYSRTHDCGQGVRHCVHALSAGTVFTCGSSGLRPSFAVGLANFSMGHLFAKHRILATPIAHPAVKGVRVTPNVYTTPQEIDVFIAAVEKVIRDGLPSA
jgi:hypothetical protein